MKNLILIPARSGSTRVKNKNIRLLNNKPLVAHAISAGLESGAARVVVSTNSSDIAEIAKQYGADIPFLRPDELSTATAPSNWVILHALKWFLKNENWTPDTVAYCPPTNPFIQAQTIADMFSILDRNPEANSIVTITQPQTHPFRIVLQNTDLTIKAGVITIDGKTIMDIERSQDWPIVWEGSPACRMTRARFFLDQLKHTDDYKTIIGKTYDPEKCLGHEIPTLESFDIDDEKDWSLAEYMVRQKENEPE